VGYPMRSAVAVAVVLAAFYACGGGFTSSNNVPPITDSGVNSRPSADSGADAGDAGDAGAADAGDAGCPQLAATMAVLDQCAGGLNGNASIVPSGLGCFVDINMTTSSSPCSLAFGDGGVLNGSCQGAGLQNCTATSLPGVLRCALPVACTITFCDAGTTCL
jgi:hypothetical protein